MSVDDAATDPAHMSAKARRLAEYLRTEAADGEIYVKSKFICEDVELSAKEVGAQMRRLQESVPDLTIEKWSYTSATTWRVTRTENV